MATAYYEVQRNAGELKRILKVEGVKDQAHAAKLAERIRAVHADKVLGSPRRYSTGTGTVTIPE